MKNHLAAPALLNRCGVAAALSLISHAPAAEHRPWLVKPTVPAVQQLFPQGAVTLLEGPFKTMQDADHAYLIRLEPDRLLAQFRIQGQGDRPSPDQTRQVGRCCV